MCTHTQRQLVAYFPIDVLQHNVLRFKISVYDLVLVEILDTRSCGDQTAVLHKDTANVNQAGAQNNGLRQDVPTSLSNDSTSLSFRPQQFSGLLSNCNQHISTTLVGILHCLPGTNKEGTLTYQTYRVGLLRAATFLRSPLEQYSMARSGRSFKAISFISSGTSLAVTTLMWFNLGEERFIAGSLFQDQLRGFCKVTLS